MLDKKDIGNYISLKLSKFRHGNFNSGRLLSHHLFISPSLGCSLCFSNIDFRLWIFLAIGLRPNRIDVAIGLIQSEVRIFGALSLGSSERVFGFSDDIAGVRFGLYDVSTRADHIGRGNQRLQTREPGIVPPIAKRVFIRIGHFWLETRIILRSGCAAHGLGVVHETWLESDACGGGTVLTELIRVYWVEIDVLSVVMVVFGLSQSVTTHFGTDDVCGCLMVFELVGHVVVWTHWFLPWVY